MEKTEKRTAEDILKEHGLGVTTLLNVSGEYSTVDAMHEYATQKLDAYKTRLKEAISKHQLYGETTNLVKRYEILNLIDKL